MSFYVVKSRCYPMVDRFVEVKGLEFIRYGLNLSTQQQL